MTRSDRVGYPGGLAKNAKAGVPRRRGERGGVTRKSFTFPLRASVPPRDPAYPQKNVIVHPDDPTSQKALAAPTPYPQSLRTFVDPRNQISLSAERRESQFLLSVRATSMTAAEASAAACSSAKTATASAVAGRSRGPTMKWRRGPEKWSARD